MVTIRMFGKPRAKESQRICLLVSSSHLIALALLSNRDAVYESLNVEHLAKHLLALPSLPFEAEKLKKCIQKSIKQYRNTKYTMGPSTRAKDWSRRLCPTRSENLGTQLLIQILSDIWTPLNGSNRTNCQKKGEKHKLLRRIFSRTLARKAKKPADFSFFSDIFGQNTK